MRLLSIIFLLNVIHGIFLGLILFFNSSRKINANYFLIPLLLIITGYQMKAVIVLEGYYTSFPHSIKLFLPLHFLLGPLFYYYVKFTLGTRKKLQIRDTKHLIPFIICLLSLLPFYIKSGAEKLTLHSAPAPSNFNISGEMLLYYIPILLLAIFYYWRSLQLIKESAKFLDKRSSKQEQTKSLWLEKYTRVFLFFLVCFAIAQLIFIFTDFYQFYVMLFTVFMSSILIHFIAYWAIKQSRITNTIRVEGKALTFQSKDDALDIKIKIVELLKDEQCYLNNDLSSKYFCERLEINSLYLSQIVNKEFNCNISHLINSYRVDHAKKILKSGELNHLNFSGIAEYTGFNSANAFTRVFKQHTGQTPSQYKKALEKN
ncbi:AraC family transcriptional regulator [Flavobacteriaceae bacterium S356]|uniref:AraC family transcriptional regulator n=1 Tax=Asprobacillus argus TaxID=3076534 RepID=A0ABU3LDG3_9FLAO|nr:AraC family transcriptional regulator [Flavobacteriaceae bacterium S356]